MAIPTLLLNPQESRDRNGLVVPTISGTVPMVDGRYGPAWSLVTGSVALHTTPRVRDAYGTTEGTILVRYAEPASPASAIGYIFNVGAWMNSFIGMVRYPDGRTGTYFQRPSPSGPSLLPIIPREIGHRAVAFTYDQSEVTFRDDMGHVATQPVSDAYALDFTGKGNYIGHPTQNAHASVESVLAFDRRLPDHEIERLLTMPEPWTWANLMPRIGGVVRVGPSEPLTVSQATVPEPFQITQAAPPEPLAIVRAATPEPLALTRIREGV